MPPSTVFAKARTRNLFILHRFISFLKMRLNDFPMFALLFFAVFIVAVGLIGSSHFRAPDTSTSAATVDADNHGIKINNSSILAAVAAVLSIGVLIVAGLKQKVG